MGQEEEAPRVLIVDDNLALAENIAELLSMAGCLTQVAGSGEDALPMAVSADLRVLLTDFRLPGLNGAELVDEIRGVRSDVRFYVMSAHTDEQTRNKAQAVGAGFLAKPLDMGGLAQLLLGPKGVT